MTDEKYTKRGSLYKAQQTSVKEPRAPEAQDISRLSKSTYYLALHQTIASSLRPLVTFFDSENRGTDTLQRSVEDNYQFTLRIENFEKIRLSIDRVRDKPLKRFLQSQYHRFVKYLYNQMQIPGQSVSYLKETGFSSMFERDFCSPLEIHAPFEITKNLCTDMEIAWKDPINESLYQLFLQILPPWMERILAGKNVEDDIHSTIPFMKSGLYAYLDEMYSHSYITPPPVEPLSRYQEVEESKVNETLFQYILRPHNKDLDDVKVFYDLEKEIFIVQGKGFTKERPDGQSVDPQVFVNSETGFETRIYQFQDENGEFTLEIEVFDRFGNIIKKNIEKSIGDKGNEFHEIIYENGLLKELNLKIQMKDVLEITRQYCYHYTFENNLDYISERSSVLLPVLKTLNDLGLWEMEEAQILQHFCRNHRLQMDIDAIWVPQAKQVSFKKKRMDFRIPGILSGFFIEMYEPDFCLSSAIYDSRGQILFRRVSNCDEKKNIVELLIEDRRDRLLWEQKVYYTRDNNPMSIHSVFQEPSELDIKRSTLPLYQRNTYLLSGVTLSVLEKYYNIFAHKEERHFHRYFEKFLGNQWLKPNEVKLTDSGEFIVSYKYEISPSCSLEESRYYSGDDLFEYCFHTKKYERKEDLQEEKLVKRRGREESIEIVRKKADSEYRETTNIRDAYIDRYIRSKKKSDKVPLDFFAEPNRWLEFTSSKIAGTQSFVSTYVHERINTDKSPPDRKILVREETYESEIPGAEKRDILNFLAFLDESGETHFRTKATSLRRDCERTIIWENGELSQQFETQHKPKKARRPYEPFLGKFTRNL